MTTISMGSAPIISDYTRHLRTRNCSKETIRTARHILHSVSVYAGGADLLKLDAQALQEWQATRAEQVAARTLRTYTSYVQGFYRWALGEGRILVDPATKLVTPKVPRLLPRPIDEDTLCSAIDEADAQLRAVLCLAAFAGLRACEIAGLDWSEVTLRGDTPGVRVTGKGSVERIVDASPDLIRVLAALPDRRGPVIRRRDGRPGRVSANRISSLANRYLRSLDIPDTLHSLRHRFGTVACKIGGIRIAQEALGHASPTTTAGYAKVSNRDLRLVVVQTGTIQAS